MKHKQVFKILSEFRTYKILTIVYLPKLIA